MGSSRSTSGFWPRPSWRAFSSRQPQADDARRSPALRFGEIIVTGFGKRGLFVVNAEGATICWGERPGDERPGQPSAEEKWAILVAWDKTTPARFLVEGDFWAFSKEGAQVCLCSRHEASHRRKKPSERPSERRMPMPQTCKRRDNRRRSCPVMMKGLSAAAIDARSNRVKQGGSPAIHRDAKPKGSMTHHGQSPWAHRG